MAGWSSTNNFLQVHVIFSKWHLNVFDLQFRNIFPIISLQQRCLYSLFLPIVKKEYEDTKKDTKRMNSAAVFPFASWCFLLNPFGVFEGLSFYALVLIFLYCFMFFLCIFGWVTFRAFLIQYMFVFQNNKSRMNSDTESS